MIYVAFIYGFFIPLMFPITLFGLFNTYMCEKIGIIWFYRKPPMLDNSLFKRAFTLMRFPPVLMCMMGYWAVGNQQIFESVSTEKIFNNRAGDPQHDIVPTNSNQVVPCLVGFICGIYFTVYHNTCTEHAKQTCCKEKHKE